MRTFNTKLAIRVFAIIAAVDVVGSIIGHFHPGGLFMTFARIINWPVLKFAELYLNSFRTSSLGTAGLLIGSLLFNAILWSLIAGYVFHRKSAA
jgi:hypothetical protein